MTFGTILLVYEFVDNATDQSSKQPLKLKSQTEGTVQTLIAREGDIIQPGCELLELQSCLHSVIMKDLCAECGADLRQLKLAQSVADTSVSMIHSVPELRVSQEQARKLGEADEQRLLKNRKLVLLVDLDQTLIHTTNEIVPADMKGVFHFQLYGFRSPWYHTKFRPGTQEFLEKISKLYELHIFTFGARPYAHHIASLLDPNGCFFSHRILSRDECLNASSKSGNLKALFPCGDSMVCIIDDREDVWNFAPNVVQVKPYHFFTGTGDINSPPGMDSQDVKSLSKKYEKKTDISKTDLEEKTASKGKLIEEKEGIMSKDKVQSSVAKQIKDASSSEHNKNPGLAINSNCDINSQFSDSERNSSDSQKEGRNGDQINNDNNSVEASSEENSSKNEKVKDRKSEITTFKNGEETAVRSEEEAPVKSEEEAPVKSEKEAPVNSEEPPPVKSEEAEAVKSGEEESEKMEVETCSKSVEGLSAKNGEKTPAMSGKESPKKAVEEITLESRVETSVTIYDTDNDNEDEKKINDSQSSESLQLDTSIDALTEEDDYLMYLEEILSTIHKAFYDMHDQLLEQGKKIPDLKSVIPYVRRKVLKGVNIVFSGVIPTTCDPEKSKLWILSKAFGANVTVDLLSADHPNTTTHVLAARMGTAKVNKAKKMKGVHIVNPEWLTCCTERWEKVDERLFPLTEEVVSRKPEKHPENRDKMLMDFPPNVTYTGHAMRTVPPPAEPCPVYDPVTGKRVRIATGQKLPAFPVVHVKNLRRSKRSGGRQKSQQPPDTFSNSLSPLLSFSTNEIEAMGREVDDACSEESENEGERSGDSEGDPQPDKVEGSSSEDSLDFERPHGWRKKQKTENGQKITDDGFGGVLESEDETCVSKFPRNEIPIDSDKSDASDSDDMNESIGSVDEEMAAAVEREFLAS